MKCPECGEEFAAITPAHVKHKHNMTMKEFREKYPKVLDFTKYLKRPREKNSFTSIGKRIGNRQL